MLEARVAQIIEQEAWAKTPGQWNGDVELGVNGAPLSIIFFTTAKVGAGPRLHRHPYSETFIIRTGRALFAIGDDEVEAHAGQILVVPADTPHKFHNLGPDLLDTINIHASGSFTTDWLE
jgi:mannose-6-phosphate isomerase-like protein (cupin superfamily)